MLKIYSANKIMKLFYSFVILILFQSCSFDKKSGIWSNDKNIASDKDVYKDFKTLISAEKSFDQIISLQKNFSFKLPNAKINYAWSDIFFDQNNNYINFKYDNLNKLILKSKKITRHKLNSFLLYEDNNIITSDHKGNIIVFSINENKIISKFNFYKKKYKKINKSLNLIIEDNIIYVSDNIGYLYAYDYKIDNLIWAKNYKVPFRSNLKLKGDKLIGSTQNNNLFFFDKKNGIILKTIPTEDSVIKNKFINNLSLNNNSVFFLNTYGSLYSLDIKSMKIRWFANLNQTLNLNPSNLFSGNQIINNEERIVLNSNKHTYVIDTNSGQIIHKKNFSSNVKPILISNYLFIVTKNNLLISFDIISGNILYSHDVNKKISEYLDIKKKQVDINNIMIANNKILIFLKSSYLLIFDINGVLLELPSKILSQPIIIENSILYLDKKNKLLVVN